MVQQEEEASSKRVIHFSFFSGFEKNPPGGPEFKINIKIQKKADSGNLVNTCPRLTCSLPIALKPRLKLNKINVRKNVKVNLKALSA